jgi:IS5 family transposase
VLHAGALPGNPYDGHTLGGVIEATEKLTGCPIERGLCRQRLSRPQNHNPAARIHLRPETWRLRNHQTRAQAPLSHRACHMKTDGHLGRCYLKGRDGNAANVVLSAVGHNLRLVLAWLRMLLRLILNVLSPLLTARTPLKWAS